MAYRNGCGEDGREGYSLEGESPSMMTLGNTPSGVFSLLSLFRGGESGWAVAFLFSLRRNLSIVSCFCLFCTIFRKCAITVSLKIITARLLTAVSGWYFSTNACNSPHLAHMSLITALEASSLTSSSSEDSCS